jgi:D-alanyl-lipoteichoic acid acyltransferase DltB (MBOAT superfamily)
VLFNSFEFLGFIVAVYCLYLVLDRKWQNRMLLAASYVFYGSWDWRFLSLIAISTGVDFICGAQIHKALRPRRRKLFLAISMAVNLGLLGTFKYFDFFAESLQALAAGFGWQFTPVTIDLILPVGISFYTFQTMSYTIDIYRGKLEPSRSLLDFALFVAFFPQLVAGPIERAQRLLPQIMQPRHITRRDIGQGLWLIFWGYFLKVYVADNLAKISDGVFAVTGMTNGAEALMGIYSFHFQVLGDFAGYSSIAIGVARLMGIKLMINFLYPYFVTNPRDFWANWHISLSTWLRDYLYFPLGGNRKGEVRKYFNLFITMLLGGLWHGAAWTFVVWGLFHSAILIFHRLLEPVMAHIQLRGLPDRLWLLVRILFFFHVLCLGAMIFRCQSVTQIGTMLASVFTNFGPITPRAAYFAWQVFSCASLVLLIHYFQKRKNDVLSVAAIPAPIRLPLLILMGYLMLIWGEYGGKEFIYFQF